MKIWGDYIKYSAKPTLVLMPGRSSWTEKRGQSPWGSKESVMTEVTKQQQQQC